MNSALFHIARPGDIRDEGRRRGGAGGGGAGMQEAAALAKEMGFGPEFGPQVRSATTTTTAVTLPKILSYV